jgi:hypothetical protein
MLIKNPTIFSHSLFVSIVHALPMSDLQATSAGASLTKPLTILLSIVTALAPRAIGLEYFIKIKLAPISVYCYALRDRAIGNCNLSAINVTKNILSKSRAVIQTTMPAQHLY